MMCFGQVVGPDALSIDAAIVGLGLHEAAQRSALAADGSTAVAVAAYVEVRASLR